MNQSKSGQRQTISGREEAGRVWKLPDTPTGRMAADMIDAKLSDLAHKREQDRQPGRGR